MTKQDIIKDLIATVYDGAKQIIDADATGNEEVQPTAFLLKGTQLTMVALPWQNEREKNTLMSFIRHLCQDEAVTGYAILSEAWMVSLNQDTENLGIMPSEHPDRVECLNIVAQERGKPGYLATAKITRQESGRRCVAACEVQDMEGVQGRMANLFEPREGLH